jgi:hypothetical protein
VSSITVPSRSIPLARASLDVTSMVRRKPSDRARCKSVEAVSAKRVL